MPIVVQILGVGSRMFPKTLLSLSVQFILLLCSHGHQNPSSVPALKILAQKPPVCSAGFVGEGDTSYQVSPCSGGMEVGCKQRS